VNLILRFSTKGPNWIRRLQTMARSNRKRYAYIPFWKRPGWLIVLLGLFGTYCVLRLFRIIKIGRDERWETEFNDFLQTFWDICGGKEPRL
jgi:hypothetical protein